MADRPCFAPAVARGLALAVAAWSLSSASADAQTMDQLHALARQDRNVVVCAGGPAAGYEAAAHAFEQRYPGIPVAVTAGFSNVLDRKIDEQLVSGQDRGRCGDPADHPGPRALEQRRAPRALQARWLRGRQHAVQAERRSLGRDQHKS